jgi:two-component system, sensor histidine kinase PdtaS
MATLAELTRQHTSLSREEITHLQDLLGDWGMLADFCFADLLLYLPTNDGQWLTVAQVRPSTGQTLYHADWVGTAATPEEVAILSAAHSTGTAQAGEIDSQVEPGRAMVRAIPVRRGDRVIGVLTREWAPGASGRQPGELERRYLTIFDRFAEMITEGSFPFHGRQPMISAAPRVGDGVMILDADAAVLYASPNAVSALHRVGITANVVGIRLAELGFNDGTVRAAYERREPVLEEFDQTADVTLLVYCIPLLADGGVTGGVVLLRDVTELRRRDRLLLSKDATIREIHHRVKNNLQTISSLLRLQSRRLTSVEAKAAVNESVRRIRTIALVHETLSREAGDDVAFTEIVRPLLRLAEEGLQSQDRPVQFTVSGDGGKLPAIVATPLSVVLTELLQNAVDHGFPEGSGGGRVNVQLANDAKELVVRVVDDGQGVAPDFQIDNATGLGLVIVRTLVTTELAGTIEMKPASPTDIAGAGLQTPARGTGTLVELRVPINPD